MCTTSQPPTDSKRVLLVDDMPDNLRLLSEALDGAGYTVLVATDGNSALDSIDYVTPDVILLDAVMPGLDGFETCRRLKAHRVASRIPVIFMTGLTEPDDVVRGFQAGGIDYVTKPVETSVVLARIESHLRHARMMSSAMDAMDAAAHAVVVLDTAGDLIWETRRARQWLTRYFGETDERGALPAELARWVEAAVAAVAAGGPPATTARSLGESRLEIRLSATRKPGEVVLLLDEQKACDPEAALAAYQLTPREREVLGWLAKGKTNRDISEILGMSPRTVNKHLEHIFVKLGVETRAAAAALAIQATQGGRGGLL